MGLNKWFTSQLFCYHPHLILFFREGDRIESNNDANQRTRLHNKILFKQTAQFFDKTLNKNKGFSRRRLKSDVAF